MPYHIALYSTLTSSSTLLASVSDFSSYSWFTRSKAHEYARFAGRTITQRTKRGTQQLVASAEYPFWVFSYNRGDGLAAVFISPPEYDKRAAQTLLYKAIWDYEACYRDGWRTQLVDHEQPLPSLANDLRSANDPATINKFVAMERKLDEVKELTKRNISALLERGETIEELARRSQDLSKSSKLFLKDSKRLSRCCGWFW